jgi:hypothetical protein
MKANSVAVRATVPEQRVSNAVIWGREHFVSPVHFWQGTCDGGSSI